LPVEASEQDRGFEADGDKTLPVWLPPSRVLGGFYVMRPVGRGTAGSVFVVCRAEERHETGAERFALKVPSYGGSVAHTLSEEEFLRLFREEAGALLTLPGHPNLAGFVTFDARVRPRPILVMELVEGMTLDRAIERGELTLPRTFQILDGIAAGLEVMHAVGVGHLDLKPSNVILRAPADGRSGPITLTGGAGGAESRPAPVLVDFGLAGRKVRPGCASPFYGAPEVWVTDPSGHEAIPAAADVYSFSCLAYELVTGQRLFSGETLPAVVAAHFGHDGNPAGLGPLRANPHFGPLAEWLSAGLRPSPRRRPSIVEMRAGLAAVAADFAA
jgi:serine/threonine protein kinase